MEYKYYTIQCHKHFPFTCRRDPFGVADYILNYQSCREDKELIDSLLEKAEKLTPKVNPGTANDSSHTRTESDIKADCIAGIVSEYFWRIYLNQENEIVTETCFEKSATQTDLKVITTGRKIEVRSSFPKNGIEFALCHPQHQFDILGLYNNSYKPGEIQKDYYVRCLFHLPYPKAIITMIREDGFHVYLTGGATWNMMTDEQCYKIKSLPSNNNPGVEKRTQYRVIPFSNALDTASIKDAIINNS